MVLSIFSFLWSRNWNTRQNYKCFPIHCSDICEELVGVFYAALFSAVLCYLLDPCRETGKKIVRKRPRVGFCCNVRVQKKPSDTSRFADLGNNIFLIFIRGQTEARDSFELATEVKCNNTSYPTSAGNTFGTYFSYQKSYSFEGLLFSKQNL